MKLNGVHEHIKGLGLDDSCISVQDNESIIGHEDAREAFGLVLAMIRKRKFSGRGILLTGPIGCGKTAMAIALSKEIGDLPFVKLNGSEVYSSREDSNSILEDAIRKSIILRTKDTKDVYEGEVTKLSIKQEHSKKKLQFKVKEIEICLKTSKNSKKLKLCGSFYNLIRKEKIQVGDIVIIEADAGIIRKLGRCDAFIQPDELQLEKYLPLPKYEVCRRKEVVQEITLFELDKNNSVANDKNNLTALFQLFNRKRNSCSDKVRREVDKIVSNYISKGNAELLPGVLFIDEVHLLDVYSFTFLHKIMESPSSPIIIFATNKNKMDVNGTTCPSFFGIPKDLLDRLLRVNLNENSMDNKIKILGQKINQFGLSLNKDSTKALNNLLIKYPLRFVISLLPFLKLEPDLTEKKVNEIADYFQDH